MKNLIKFNEQFPNGVYRKVGDYIELPKNFTKEQYSVYQKSKAPIGKSTYNFEQVKTHKGRIGWIVPEEYIVIDIDNKRDAENVYALLQTEDVKFGCMMSRKGGHFIFKNPRKVSQTAVRVTSIGVIVDVRSMNKGYIILPHNDPGRKWIINKITNDVDDLPAYLIPLTHIDKSKVKDFSIMGEGDGRNTELFKHFKNLQDYADELNIDEKIESIKLINKYILREKIDEQELNSTVLSEKSVNKPVAEKRRKSTDLEVIARKILKDKIIITVNGISYIYNGAYYQRMTNGDLALMIHNEYDSSLVEHHRKEVIAFIKLKTHKNPDEINKQWNTIVCKNGILDITNLKLYPHTPSHLSTVYIDHNIQLDVPDGLYSKIMDDFLNVISNGIAEKRQLLLEMVGSCFLQRNIFNKFFLFVGEGSTGKSTFLEMISHLVGASNTEHLSLTDLDDSYKPAELFGKLVNLGDDISFKRLRDTSTLKKLVTGNFVTVRQIYGSPFSFQNFAKLIYTTNKVPAFSDKTTGLLRRLMIIEINTPIQNPDPFFLMNLTEKDYEYLFYKAIVAVYDALKRGTGLTKYSKLSETLEQFKQNQSSVNEYVTYELITPTDLHGIPAQEAFNAYKVWCQDAGYKPLIRKHFVEDLLLNMPALEHKPTTFNGDKQRWRFMIK